MQIMVCGPLGRTGPAKINSMIRFLEKNGFELVKQIVKRKTDYSMIKDFRKRKKLAGKIIMHDFQIIKKTDVLIILAEPSFGAAIEMYVGKSLKKKIILFAVNPVSSPWPVKFSDIILTNKKDLIKYLHKINKLRQ